MYWQEKDEREREATKSMATVKLPYKCLMLSTNQFASMRSDPEAVHKFLWTHCLMQSSKMDEKSRKILEKRGHVSLLTSLGSDSTNTTMLRVKQSQCDAPEGKNDPEDSPSPLVLPKGDSKIKELPEKQSCIKRQSSLVPDSKKHAHIAAPKGTISRPQTSNKQDLVARLKAAEQEVVALRDVCLRALIPDANSPSQGPLQTKFSTEMRDASKKDEVLRFAGIPPSYIAIFTIFRLKKMMLNLTQPSKWKKYSVCCADPCQIKRPKFASFNALRTCKL